jgi:ankyrin repeat protein
MIRRPAAACLVLTALATACGHPDPSAVTELASAARRGDTVRIAALAAAGHDVNGADPGLNHWTPLLHAIHKGQRGSVEALIAAGADVNRATRGGVSPLEMAAGNGQLGIVRRLLATGADPTEPGVFTAAVGGGGLTDIENPLLGECNAEIVRALLARAPQLRLPRNIRGRLALAFARFNHCSDVLEMARLEPEQAAAAR